MIAKLDHFDQVDTGFLVHIPTRDNQPLGLEFLSKHIGNLKAMAMALGDLLFAIRRECASGLSAILW